jgi:5-formaminoimidazole-4-carboxamide-1-beta-D-ribofuranosyl 5'-monophosphate synthetase
MSVWTFLERTPKMHLVNRTFRLNHATMGIRGEGKDSTAVLIPAGSTITVINYDEGPFRKCLWGGRTVLVMKTDIETRATLLAPAEGLAAPEWQSRSAPG